jgi:eukaryotic-like serine/threonine-protein kinase
LGARRAAAAAGAAATQVGPAVAAYEQGSATATMAQPQAPMYAEPPRRDGRRTVFAVLALLVLIGLLIGLVYALRDALGLGGDEEEGVELVEVPSVLDDPYEEAVATLEAANLEHTVEYVPNEEVEEGIVFAQDPPGGQKVEPASVVKLTVSEGEGLLPVPGVVGDPVVDAEALLRAAGFDVSITYAENAFIPLDAVVSQDPPAGEGAPRGAVVAIVVSSGPPLRDVPQLEGKSEAEAVAAVVSAGFEFAILEEPSESVEEGKVIRTDPPGGTQLKGGQTVTIVLSSGRPTARVPAVVGILADTAITEIRNRGFVPNPVFQSVPAGSPDNGRVISQNPVADTEQELGSAVTIVVGRVTDATTTTTTTTTTAPPSG